MSWPVVRVDGLKVLAMTPCPEKVPPAGVPVMVLVEPLRQMVSGRPVKETVGAA